MKALLLFILCTTFSCGFQNEKKLIREDNVTKLVEYDYGCTTIIHDSCEYVVFKDWGRSDIAALHKQNCKFCMARNKK